MGKTVRALFLPIAKKKKLKGDRKHLLLLDFRVINGTTKKGKEAENRVD